MTEPETGPRGHDIANGILAIPALEQLARDLETPTRNQDETGTEQVAKPAR